MRDYITPAVDVGLNSIVRPKVNAQNFEIKPSFIQWLQSLCLFKCMPGEDPNEHIRPFLEVCNTFKMQGMTEEAARLKLFPFSPKHTTKEWLSSLPTNSISTWAEMAHASSISRLVRLLNYEMISCPFNSMIRNHCTIVGKGIRKC